MALCKYLGFFCVLVCFYQVLGDTDEPLILAEVDGAYIVSLGEKYDDATVRLLGEVFKNFERNMSKVKEQTKVEFFLQRVCESSECEPWPDYPECPAAEGHFSVVTRTRECGRNTSRCSYPQSRNESQTTVCAGAITSVVSEDPDENGCPTNYDNVDGYCLLWGRYTFVPHSEAMSECAVHGGVLVNVDSKKKEDAVYRLLDNYSFIQSIWIDGERQSASQSFQYISGNAAPSYENWHLGEPTDGIIDPDTNQEVYHLCKADLSTDPRSWMAQLCHEEYSFVCEYVNN